MKRKLTLAGLVAATYFMKRHARQGRLLRLG